jgi:hypothetical protein
VTATTFHQRAAASLELEKAGHARENHRFHALSAYIADNVSAGRMGWLVCCGTKRYWCRSVEETAWVVTNLPGCSTVVRLEAVRLRAAGLGVFGEPKREDTP